MLSSGLSVEICDDETLSRFVYESSKFNTLGAKPAAFMPDGGGETSVFRVEDFSIASLESLGRSARKDKTVYGASLLKPSDVREIGLECESDEPPARHAIITGWPEHEEGKARALSLAQRIMSKQTWIKIQ